MPHLFLQHAPFLPAILLLLPLAGGCVQRHHPRHIATAQPALPVAATLADADAAASAVFPPPALAAYDPWRDSQPWYADRMDRGPSIFAGYQTPTRRTATTFTVDREASYRGRVYNSYRTTTYTTQTREGVR